MICFQAQQVALATIRRFDFSVTYISVFLVSSGIHQAADCQVPQQRSTKLERGKKPKCIRFDFAKPLRAMAHDAIVCKRRSLPACPGMAWSEVRDFLSFHIPSLPFVNFTSFFLFTFLSATGPVHGSQAFGCYEGRSVPVVSGWHPGCA